MEPEPDGSNNDSVHNNKVHNTMNCNTKGHNTMDRNTMDHNTMYVNSTSNGHQSNGPNILHPTECHQPKYNTDDHYSGNGTGGVSDKNPQQHRYTLLHMSRHPHIYTSYRHYWDPRRI